jgi:hypothetical protein
MCCCVVEQVVINDLLFCIFMLRFPDMEGVPLHCLNNWYFENICPGGMQEILEICQKCDTRYDMIDLHYPPP